MFKLREQIKNKYFWLSVVSLLILTCDTFGINVLPVGFEETMQSVLTRLVGMGILNNNMTEGLGE